MKIKASIKYHIKKNHPDIKYIENWDAKNGKIHHATLASIARAWRWSYATGAIKAKREGIKIV